MGQLITVYYQGQPIQVDSDNVSGVSGGFTNPAFTGGIRRPGSNLTGYLKANRGLKAARAGVEASQGADALVAASDELNAAKDTQAAAKDDLNAGLITGGLGAGTEVIGGIVGGIQAQKRLNDLEKNGIPDLMPQSLKDGMGEARLGAKSAKVANYNQQAGQIENNANVAAANATSAATGPSQIIQASTNIQANKNQAYNNLDSQGLASQQDRINRLNEFRKLRASYDDENRRTRQGLITDAKNARNQNFLNAGKGLAQGALLAV